MNWLSLSFVLNFGILILLKSLFFEINSRGQSRFRAILATYVFIIRIIIIIIIAHNLCLGYMSIPPESSDPSHPPSPNFVTNSNFSHWLIFHISYVFILVNSHVNLLSQAQLLQCHTLVKISETPLEPFLFHMLWTIARDPCIGWRLIDISEISKFLGHFLNRQEWRPRTNF